MQRVLAVVACEDKGHAVAVCTWVCSQEVYVVSVRVWCSEAA
jgi:hypothetical protein